ncbi:MAG: hypothetical protein WKF55_07975 [Gemmatimonadaceae bacterium]
MRIAFIACSLGLLATLAVPVGAQPSAVEAGDGQPVGARLTGRAAAVPLAAPYYHRTNRDTGPARRGGPDLEVEVRAASRYAGWGGAMGAAIGVGAGLVRSRRSEHGSLLRAFQVVAYGLTGSVVGITAGSAVYVVRRLSGWRPAT